MKQPEIADFAQFRFVRTSTGNLVTLPAKGIDEQILLVLDCERYRLARLHIFERAALREDRLEAFEAEMERVAAIQHPAVSRLISWGRDEEELFYADEMRDAEPLPDYLGRTGGVSFSVAASWILRLLDGVESAGESIPPTLERYANLNLQVERDRTGQVVPSFSEFQAWMKPGVHVAEHSRVYLLAQVFCASIVGVPARVFSHDSLPRNFDELAGDVRETVLAALDDDGNVLDSFREAMTGLAASNREDDHARTTLSPASPLVAWLGNELTAAEAEGPSASLPAGSFPPGEASEVDDPYSTPATLRGLHGQVRVIPGEEALPRNHWLRQHYEAMRRPGRGMVNQLTVLEYEKRGAVSLVGEECPEGVDLELLVIEKGPLPWAHSLSCVRRTVATLRRLEDRTGSCAVWWLPPDAIHVVTGAAGADAAAGFFRRRGAAAWDETPMRLRLHQHTRSLLRGVDLPDNLLELGSEPGRGFAEARHSAITMQLLWFLRTGERLPWYRPVHEDGRIPEPVCHRLEEYRNWLVHQPRTPRKSFLEEWEQLEKDSPLAGAVDEPPGYWTGEEGASSPVAAPEGRSESREEGDPKEKWTGEGVGEPWEWEPAPDPVEDSEGESPIGDEGGEEKDHGQREQEKTEDLRAMIGATLYTGTISLDEGEKTGNVESASGVEGEDELSEDEVVESASPPPAESAPSGDPGEPVPDAEEGGECEPDDAATPEESGREPESQAGLDRAGDAGDAGEGTTFETVERAESPVDSESEHVPGPEGATRDAAEEDPEGEEEKPAGETGSPPSGGAAWMWWILFAIVSATGVGWTANEWSVASVAGESRSESLFIESMRGFVEAQTRGHSPSAFPVASNANGPSDGISRARNYRDEARYREAASVLEDGFAHLGEGEDEWAGEWLTTLAQWSRSEPATPFSLALCEDDRVAAFALRTDPLGTARDWVYAAERGDPVAARRLGQAHLGARHLPASGLLGVRWLEEAANAGDSEARYLHARLGRGVSVNEPDGERARRHLEQAAAAGHGRARFLLACHLLDRESGPREAERAFVLARSAAANGIPEAWVLLGLCRATATGAAGDPREAFLAFVRAAAGGNRDGMRLLSHCHETGFGTFPCPDSARRWSRLARHAPGHAIEG